MQVLASRFNPVPLGAFSDQDSWGNRRRVAISFDDGYSDNFLEGRPVLIRLGIPATFFICSGVLTGGREFWWDELYRLILDGGQLPGTLKFQCADHQVFHWDLPVEKKAGGFSGNSWIAGNVPPSARHALYYALWQFLQPLGDEDQQQVLQQLAELMGASRTPREEYLPMTPGQLRELAAMPLFEIGAHTVTHPMLGLRTAQVQQMEIRDNLHDLEMLTGRKVRGMAYPYGHFNTETLKIARDCGLQWACTTQQGTVGPDTPVFTLPRFSVHDWSGEEFATRLRAFFHKPVLYGA